jgi:predicted nucleotidyltransferase
MQRDEVLERLAERRRELNDLGVKSLALFGSMARDESSERSDVDLLVEFNRSVGLLKFVRVQRYLAELLESRVDLVTLDALKPKMREEVLAEAIHAA